VSRAVPPGALPPGTLLRRGDGTTITLGELLADGGEGFVYAVVEDPAIVVKLIRPELREQLPAKAARMRAMITNPPPNWRESSSGHVVLSWPIDTVDHHGAFAGFTMPRVDLAATAEIHNIQNPSDRRDPSVKAPPWIQLFTWRYHVQTGANLALATQMLHEGGYVVGDFNERNIFVTGEARVTLVDCDSMQVPNPGGAPFLCLVGRPEYTAPELYGADLSATPRQPSSDLFALAVHIHLLLLNNHYPFDGMWRGRGEKPGRRQLVRDGVYAGGGGSLRPAQFPAGVDLLPETIRDLFRRAFVSGAKDPALRPAASEWNVELRKLGSSLVPCSAYPTEHVYSDHLRDCPWCAEAARAMRQQVPLPTPVVVPPPVAPAPPVFTAPTQAPAPPPRVRTAPSPARPARPAAGGGAGGGRSLRRVIGWAVALAVLVFVAVVVNALSSGSDTAASPPAKTTSTTSTTRTKTGATTTKHTTTASTKKPHKPTTSASGGATTTAKHTTSTRSPSTPAATHQTTTTKKTTTPAKKTTTPAKKTTPTPSAGGLTGSGGSSGGGLGGTGGAGGGSSGGLSGTGGASGGGLSGE
jgi:hypothetical protein